MIVLAWFRCRREPPTSPLQRGAATRVGVVLVASGALSVTTAGLGLRCTTVSLAGLRAAEASEWVEGGLGSKLSRSRRVPPPAPTNVTRPASIAYTLNALTLPPTPTTTGLPSPAAAKIAFLA